jgi:hypothetical protein
MQVSGAAGSDRGEQRRDRRRGQGAAERLIPRQFALIPKQLPPRCTATRQRVEQNFIVARCAVSGLLQSGLAQHRLARAGGPHRSLLAQSQSKQGPGFLPLGGNGVAGARGAAVAFGQQPARPKRIAGGRVWQSPSLDGEKETSPRGCEGGVGEADHQQTGSSGPANGCRSLRSAPAPTRLELGGSGVNARNFRTLDHPATRTLSRKIAAGRSGRWRGIIVPTVERNLFSGLRVYRAGV